MNTNGSTLRSRTAPCLASALVLYGAGLRALGQTVTLVGDDPPDQSSFNTGLNWSDGLPPSAAKHYAAGRILRTPPSAGPHAFGGASLTVSAGGELRLARAGTNTVADLRFTGGRMVHDAAGTAAAHLAGNVTVSNRVVVDGAAGGGPLEIGAAISGPGDVVFRSAVPGLVAVYTGAAKQYAGATIVEQGATLRMGIADAVPFGAGRGNVAVGPGSLLDLGGRALTVNALADTPAGGGTVDTTAGAGTTVLTLGAGDASGDFSGNIGNSSGTLALDKIGAGTQGLGGTSTFGGPLRLLGGRLRLNAARALDGGGQISFEGGALMFSSGNTNDYSSRFSAAPGQQYHIDTSGQRVTFSTPLTSAGGSLTKRGMGTLVLPGAAHTFSGELRIGWGALELESLGDGGPGAMGSGDIMMGDPALWGGGVLRYVGGGASTTRRVNHYGTTGSLEGFAVDASGSGPLTIGGATISGGASASLTLTGTSAHSNTVSGVMDDGNAAVGGLGLIKDGPGLWVLAASNTYSGATTIKAGRLALTGPGYVGGNSIMVYEGAVLDVSGTTGTYVMDTNQFLIGKGTVRGDLAVGGGVWPYYPGPGVLTFEDSLTLDDATMQVMVLGMGGAGHPEGHSQIVLNGGALNLAHSPPISVDLNFDHDPGLGSRFVFARGYGSLSGEFANETLIPALNPPASWQTKLKFFRVDRSVPGELALEVWSPMPGSSHLIVTAAGPGGWISPISPFVDHGDSVLFTIKPDPWFDVADVVVNGGSVGAVTNYHWANVTAPGTIAAAFAAQMVTSAPVAVPKWWLAAHGLTNAMDDAVWEDQDGDGEPAWKEYAAETDPTNRASVLRITRIGMNEPIEIGFEPGSTGRCYTLQTATNLAPGAWTNVPGQGPRPGAGGPDAMVHTNAFGDRRFYRVLVEMP